MIIVTDALEHYEKNISHAGHRSIETAGIWATYPQDHVTNLTGFFDQVYLIVLFNYVLCQSSNLFGSLSLNPAISRKPRC